MKYTPKTKPFPHQARGTLRAARAKNYALWFEPRCGKSKAALDTVGIWALQQSQQPKPLRVLIIAPRIAIDVWEDQIDQHYPFRATVEDFEAKWLNACYRDPKRNMTIRNTSFFLASREEVFARQRVVKSGKHKGKRYNAQRDKGNWKYHRPKQVILEAWDPDVIILDESHEYSRASGVAAQDCWRLVRRLRACRASSQSSSTVPRPWIIELTGTPKDYIHVFSQFRVMDDSVFGTSVADFKEDHIIYGTGKRRWTIIKYTGEKKILRKIRDHSYSVSAEEAGLANEVFYQSLKVRLPEVAARMYLEMVEEFMTEWEGGVISAKNAGVKRLRLLQITGGFTTDGAQIHRAKEEKLQAYANLLYSQGESVVVYSRFSPEVLACEEVLRRAGFDTSRVDGTVSRAARTKAIASLRHPRKKPTAISFQYQAGSRAIELVGAAETVYYSTPDSWVDYFQTMKRIQGPNQKRPVRYTHLICPGTVDVSVVRGLQQKENFHDTMMRNPRGFLMGLI